MNYEEFIASKQTSAEQVGLQGIDLNDALFPFQKSIVAEALKKGRYAVFADCGLGKTLMQLEWASQVSKQTNKPVLILCPLAVKAQTLAEAKKFQIVAGENTLIHVQNYDQLHNIDTSHYSGVVLDESSILKNFNGKMRNLIIDQFSQTPYKLACTATPSPNDPMELGNHSEFLGYMSRAEILAMFFVHDGGQTSKWRLKGHATKKFYGYVSSWAVMLAKPSDIGFSDDGYNLPSLNFYEKQIKTTHSNNGLLFNDISVSATDFNKELRVTKEARMEAAAKIANNSKEQFIVWVKQNEEADLLKILIPEAVEVRGADSAEKKESKLLGFANNEFRVLITKTKIAQFGLNFQNCHNQVFASLDFSFEGLYQAIRRSYRFGQKQEVNIHLITTDTMSNVITSIKTKESNFNIMQKEMQKALRINLDQNTQIHSKDLVTDDYKCLFGDCVERLKSLKDNEADFSVFSPPFAELYTYSDSIADMGNSTDYTEFFAHFDFLVEQLARVVADGRNVAVHCMDLPIQKGKEGFIGLRDFSGMLIDAFAKHGFIYHSKVTIWKDPVVEMQRTKALGLLHKQLKKDAAMSRVGIPDYLLVFRNSGTRAVPITHQDEDSNANNYLPVDLWQKYASPIWYDINYSDTLQFRNARDHDDEKHICPLQLQTIKRAIHLWTNHGETVLSPFGGIGSEGFQSLKMGRKSISIELKQSYFEVNKQNHKRASDSNSQLEIAA